MGRLYDSAGNEIDSEEGEFSVVDRRCCDEGEQKECSGGCCGGCEDKQETEQEGPRFSQGDVVKSVLTGEDIMILKYDYQHGGYAVRTKAYEIVLMFEFELI